MDSLGAEVGQKMRSAIKAKLLELNCYVDDELPDYIMVMVANRRTKAQMNEDLNLFLNTKTEAFVEWLHIVLKKLKEVTVTNPEVYKRVSKRKSSDQEDVKVKKEKKSKKSNENVKKEPDVSLTDNLPIAAHKSDEPRAVMLEDETRIEEKTTDEFDIPLLSDVNSSNERDLKEIERKIRNVKSRLGLMVEDDLEEPLIKVEEEGTEAKKSTGLNAEPSVEDFTDNTADVNEEPDELIQNEQSYTPEKQRKHSPITFENDSNDEMEADRCVSTKKVSVLDRLGKRMSNNSVASFKEKRSSDHKKRHSSKDRYNDKSESREERRHGRRDDKKSKDKSMKGKKGFSDSPKQKSRGDKNAINQVGVMSKIYVPEKPLELDLEEELKPREVRSMVQVKPRIVPLNAPQANKNLLLKAVAEAHRSVSEATKPRLFTSTNGEIPLTRKLSHSEKVKLRNMILAQVAAEDSDSNGEDNNTPKPNIKRKDDSDSNDEYKHYVPKPLTKRSASDLPQYIPSSRQSIEELETEKSPLKHRISAKARLSGRKSPSPIIFDKVQAKVLNKAHIPDRLPIIHPPISLKIKERCKYWPSCRQGDKCEFIHPVSKCEMLPNCQYGDKCLFLHPPCKFGSACTKRDCPYSHHRSNAAASAVKSPVAQPQTCKFFPKCANSTCPYYHPKLCRFGKYCKNKKDCPFSHLATASKSSLTWRSNI